MTLMFLDGLLVILLLFGIKSVKEFYEKYKEFISLKDDLNCILRHVQITMKTAQTTIDALQKSIEFAAEHVTPHLPEANVVKEDLHFLIEQGEKVADRLETMTRNAKQNYLTPQPIDSSDARHSEEVISKQHFYRDRDYKGPIATPQPSISPRQHALEKNPFTAPSDSEESLMQHRGFFTTIKRVR
ncbi:MAG: hypothetical protein K2X98_04265 [Alphaproteobacteria bacterium]|nr:hypothetical protein [Alphaproteobacteria bacterium]MBX9977440.1 hypothetical protein [Alphaproteobacteria bacterium]